MDALHHPAFQSLVQPALLCLACLGLLRTARAPGLRPWWPMGGAIALALSLAVWPGLVWPATAQAHKLPWIALLGLLAMLPALVVGRFRNRRLAPAVILAIACIGTMVAIAGIFVLVAGTSAFSFLEYATARSVQMESVPGALAMLANLLGGPNSRIYHGFGTWQVDSPLLAILGPAWTGLTVVLIGLLGVAILYRYRVDNAAAGGLRPTSEIVQVVAALMVVLVSSRILSPQYLFWVAPFVALLSRPKTLVFWTACLLTMFGYPLNFQAMLNQEPQVVWALNIRNALLVGFLAWVLVPDLLGAARAVAGRLRPSRGARAASPGRRRR